MRPLVVLLAISSFAIPLRAEHTPEYMAAQKAATATLDRVYNFLKTNLDGKRLKSRQTDHGLDRGSNVRIVNGSEEQYSDLSRTKDGLTFKVTGSTQQTNYYPKKEGGEREEKMSGYSAYIYELTISVTQPQYLHGTFRSLANTFEDSRESTALAWALQATMKDQTLVLTTHPATFRECVFNNELGRRPCNRVDTKTFSLDGRKLVKRSIEHISYLSRTTPPYQVDDRTPAFDYEESPLYEVSREDVQ